MSRKERQINTVQLEGGYLIDWYVERRSWAGRAKERFLSVELLDPDGRVIHSDTLVGPSRSVDEVLEEFSSHAASDALLRAFLAYEKEDGELDDGEDPVLEGPRGFVERRLGEEVASRPNLVRSLVRDVVSGALMNPSFLDLDDVRRYGSLFLQSILSQRYPGYAGYNPLHRPAKGDDASNPEPGENTP